MATWQFPSSIRSVLWYNLNNNNNSCIILYIDDDDVRELSF